MPEILSQSQIDALLKGLDSTGTEAYVPENSSQKKVKEYDFKSPKKFTKEQLRTLGSLHENLARVLSSFLSGMLRSFCEATVEQIEEQRFYEYSNALPDNALICLIDLKPTNEQLDEIRMMLDTSTSIGFFMIERLLGGAGTGYNLSRDFTDIEIAILENVYKKISAIVQDVWCNYVEVRTSFSGIETNSRMLQTHAPDDVVVIVLLKVKIKDLMGSISICLPALNLEQLIGNFSSKYVRSSKKLDADKVALRRQTILNALTNSDLELKAVLQDLYLDLDDVLKLQVDDVIPLNKSVNSNIQVLVEDTPWFEAELGRTKLKKAVKIKHLI